MNNNTPIPLKIFNNLSENEFQFQVICFILISILFTSLWVFLMRRKNNTILSFSMFFPLFASFFLILRRGMMEEWINSILFEGINTNRSNILISIGVSLFSNGFVILSCSLFSILIGASLINPRYDPFSCQFSYIVGLLIGSLGKLNLFFSFFFFFLNKN